MDKVIIQITSGRGPVECCRVVAKVTELMLKEAKSEGINISVLDTKKGDINRTLLSAALRAEGENIKTFTDKWEGTILWIAQSPYRKFHKRKNWFVGVSVFDIRQQLQWNINDVKFETCRASGPGGQNVNKVETAVRGTHIPSGIQVLAMDSRSQLQNKHLCMERLEAKFMAWQTEKLVAQQQDRWQEHNELERGKPVKTIMDKL
jgi:peptide chain release factor